MKSILSRLNYYCVHVIYYMEMLLVINVIRVNNVKLFVKEDAHSSSIEKIKIICYGVDPNLELLENFVKVEIMFYGNLECYRYYCFLWRMSMYSKNNHSKYFILGFLCIYILSTAWYIAIVQIYLHYLFLAHFLAKVLK